MNFSTNKDGMADLWADPAFVDAYLAEVVRDYEEREATHSIDDELDPEHDDAMYAAACASPDLAAMSLADDMTAAEEAVHAGRRLAASQDLLFHRVLSRAAADPEPWVGTPDPTLDPAWKAPRGETVNTVRTRRCELAVRAAAADLSLRVRVSENQVRTRAHRAGVLQRRCPRIWAAFVDGRIPEQTAIIVAEIAGSLPDRDDIWQEFDARLLADAQDLLPGRLRKRARALRERLHPESIEQRHARAAADRNVWFEYEVDGIARITALAPAAHVHEIEERVEDHARHLAAQPGEERTLPQLRTDVFCDLLRTADLGLGVTTTVRVTVPVLTLLGQSDVPATLDGVGPIDLETAKRLAGSAKGWIRVLTDPISGTVLCVDRKMRKVPADLERYVETLYLTCIFPGCNRPSHLCDLDHRTRWADGGLTAADNLGPLCQNHHTLKDGTAWSLTADADGTLTWTSPTGATTGVDPPPF